MLRYDRERLSGKGWSWDYTLMVIGLGLLIIFQPVILPWLGIYTAQVWGVILQAIGTILILFSYVLHIWSRVHLQKFYAERVELQPDHKVIDTGPYALVRHPIIVSFFMLAGGLLIFAPAVTTLFLFVYTVWDFSRAACQEEDLMKKELPGYLEYMRRVPRFFPRKWKPS
jgi:protein-S-isoprenylcysteine O-methyltransferase Ste14